MRTKISKAAAKTDDQLPHELTNITVKEVSVVDRAANKRTFLVTKNEKNPRTENALSFLASRSRPAGNDLASDLDARDVQNVQKTDAEKLIEAKDAADKIAYEAERLAKEGGAKETGDVVITAAPVVAPVVDATKALDQLVASVAPAAVVAPTPTKKDEVVQPVTIVEPAPLSPSAEKVKEAIILAITGISDKVAQFKTAIQEADSKNTDQISGRPWAVWEYSYYIQDMLNALSRIGGADWEVAAASFAKALQSDISKGGNKAITATRVGVLKGVHEGLLHATGTMTKVMKELTDETPDEVVSPDASASFAKTAPVAAAPAPAIVPAPVVVTDPAMVAKMEIVMASIANSEKVVKSLQDIIAAQSTEIAKARGEVSSNAISPDKEKVNKSLRDDDNLKWSENEDMAPRSRPRPPSF